MPEQVGRGHRHRDKVAPVDGYARSLGRHVARSALLHPTLQTDVPEREGLKCCRLARIVGTDQDYPIAQLEFDVIEQFEVANRESGQHVEPSKTLLPQAATRRL